MNYKGEIETAEKQQEFSTYDQIIKLPFNKYLTLEPRKGNVLFLFKIKDYKKNGLIYHSVYLRQNKDKYYTVIEERDGEITFGRFICSNTTIFDGLNVSILPVNSLIKYNIYSYGMLKNNNIQIQKSSKIDLDITSIK